MTKLTITIEAENYAELREQIINLLYHVEDDRVHAPTPPTYAAAAPAYAAAAQQQAYQEAKVQSHAAADPVGEASIDTSLPKRRGRKANGPQVMHKPNFVAEEVQPPAEEGERSRDDVIDELTLIFKGSDAGTRDKIKQWRNKLGYTLIRDITDKDVPAAIKFIDELTAGA